MKITTLSSFIIALALYALAAPSLFAQERGRLTDGRAFRTDPEGNQLVDYIAELEVNADALKTRVRGLEDEIVDKQAAIDRFKAQGCVEQGVRERVIGSDSATTETQPLQQCIAEQQQIATLNNELETMRADLQVERELAARSKQESALTIESLNQKLSVQQQQIAALSGDLDISRTLQEEAEVKLAKARKAAEQTARLDPAIESGDEARGSLSVARLRAVEVVRGRARTELNQLKGLIAARDQSYARYRAAHHSVSFKPQPAVSEFGSSVKDLEERLANANSVTDTSKITREIEQIRSRMHEDVALMRRIERR